MFQATVRIAEAIDKITREIKAFRVGVRRRAEAERLEYATRCEESRRMALAFDESRTDDRRWLAVTNYSNGSSIAVERPHLRELWIREYAGRVLPTYIDDVDDYETAAELSIQVAVCMWDRLENLFECEQDGGGVVGQE